MFIHFCKFIMSFYGFSVFYDFNNYRYNKQYDNKCYLVNFYNGQKQMRKPKKQDIKWMFKIH